MTLENDTAPISAASTAGQQPTDSLDIEPSEVEDASSGSGDAASSAMVKNDAPRSVVRRKKSQQADPNGPMKLRDFAAKYGISYGTAHKHWNQGRIRGKQLASGTIRVYDYYENEVAAVGDENSVLNNAAVLYARVPAQQDSEQAKEAARQQMYELETYALNSGYEIVHKAGDIAMALAPNRNNFLEILNRRDWRVLVVHSREVPMLTGLPYLEAALSASGKRIEYMDAAIGYAENDVLDFAKQTKHLLGSLIGGVRKHDVKLGLERLVR